MYRVIIVDDEPVIRRGLRETIEWDALGLEVAGEAADGNEALKLVRDIRPEILITDIRMPDMDGIALIREIRKTDLNVKITILSGYSDYDYLKEAIRLGVDNYLLKPIDNDELVSNLRNAVSEIEKEAAVSLQIRQGTVLLRSNTLRRLVTGNISPEELREKAEFLHIPMDAGQYLCAVREPGNPRRPPGAVFPGRRHRKEQRAADGLHGRGRKPRASAGFRRRTRGPEPDPGGAGEYGGKSAAGAGDSPDDRRRPHGGRRGKDPGFL